VIVPASGGHAKKPVVKLMRCSIGFFTASAVCVSVLIASAATES
jgi:hypothetical protein